MIKIPGIRTLDLPLTGGIDEISPVNKIDLKNALKMENFRISKDGKRVEKRLGLAEETTDFGEDVYGYSTYYDKDGVFNELAVLESQVKRKVTGYSWASIYSFSGDELAPLLQAAKWTCTDGWSAGTTTLVKAAGTGTGTATPTDTLTIVPGMKYKVVMTVSAAANGPTYTLGGVAGTTLTATTITDTITASTSAKIIFSGGASATCTITELSIVQATVGHPVKPLEIQGKQFVITEAGSRMVHVDKEDYQIGISAPGMIGTSPAVTIPTTTTTYSTETTMALNDLFAYADTAALDVVWADIHAGNGASTIVSSGPSAQGPDAHDLYLKLTASSYSSTTVAKRTRTLTTIPGPSYTLELNTYFGRIGVVKDSLDFRINVYNGTFLLPLYYRYGNLSIFDSKNSEYSFGTHPKEGKWQNWKFIIDGTNSTAISVKGYYDSILMKEVIYNYPMTDTPGLVEIYQNNKITDAAVMATYVDNIKITASSQVTTTTTTYADAPYTAMYRYAVTYFRGGNYGCESNPLKGAVGTKAFTGGAGNDDMTTGGTYTASSTKTFRVQIDGEGTPDTYKWSEDGGATWVSTLNLVTATVYLSYGISMTFAATTGHTTGDYWVFSGYVWSGTPVNQQVNLSSIPVSSDPQVTGRKLYRTTKGGSRFYWCATINDNTSTTYVDNLPDIALGEEMEEDHDIAPNGKLSAWWDERLWISGDDIVYDSQISYPEHFDISSRYITVQRGDMSDEITGLVPYKDSLYVFRKRSIFVIQKVSLGYGMFLVTDDVGCIAPFSVVSVNNMLMFLSHRGFELFNGSDVYGVEPSLSIDRTIKTIDMTKTDFICGVHYPEKREVWWSVPDLTKTIVYHYLADAWYYFTFYKTPSCLVSCYNSSKALVIKIGTTDGYLDLCESTYRDNTTAITATYRKPWHECGEMADVRRIDVEYEIPATMALTANIYVNFDKDIQRTDTMIGGTISAGTDIELRRPHLDFSELGQRAKYVSVELTNAENLGGNLKINEITLYVRDRAIKGEVHGD
jgi:hypothetical protein